MKWKDTSAAFPGRTLDACKQQYQRSKQELCLHVLISYVDSNGVLYIRFCKSPLCKRSVYLPMCSAVSEKHVERQIRHFAGAKAPCASARVLANLAEGTHVVHVHQQHPCERGCDWADIPVADVPGDPRIEDKDQRILADLMELVYERILVHETSVSPGVCLLSMVEVRGGTFDPKACQISTPARLGGFGLRSALYKFDDSLNTRLQFPIRLSLTFEATVAEMDRLVFITSTDGTHYSACQGGVFVGNVATLVVHHFSEYALAVDESQIQNDEYLPRTSDGATRR
ncbi:hypothetical protein AB1Y20_007137 [Prymnesium parvum]|uniref:Uncharacterized protein n=1 Tax=Prymnesium parvum TaxID=97485 RepID=A0AB34IWT5_PRYPA